MTLEEKLSDPETLSDMKKYSKLNKEYKGLQEIIEKYKSYKTVLGNVTNAKEMLGDPDAEMQAMAKEELSELEPQQVELEEQLKTLLIPKDPEDSLDIVMEIRSGTGGDEASIFAGDLYRLYVKFFDSQKWKHDVISLNEGSAGGYSKVVLEVFGENVYGKLKFESGAHRVQRVPKTESQGRVHTSAATVVVMPKYELEDIEIRKDELRTDLFRASGVRKEQAYQEQKSKRKSLVGSGDRSDKIRTYNFPQNRCTDHRIGLTLYSLGKVMDGDIGEVIEKLQMAENAEKMLSEE